MASGIVCGRVHTTATTTAAILQLIGQQRHASLVYSVFLWYWTSLLWSIDACENKVSTDEYHATTRSCASFWLNRELVSCSPVVNRTWLFGKGLMLTQISRLLFCVFWYYSNSKQKAKQYTEKLIAKLQNWNQNSRLSWVSVIGLWTTQPRRSTASRLG